jgi:high affinity Mn2+ porin
LGSNHLHRLQRDQNTEIFFDVESARGAGVSGALGLGGLGNLDAVTDHTASAAPYVARAQLRQIIRLGSETEEATRSPLSLATVLPSKRLEIRIGKMSLTDFFDLNSIGSDSHQQFLNYAIDNNAAYDIAANSRGYTYGALLEFYHPGWATRFAMAFEPKDNSGLRTDWNLSRSRSENIELELHPSLIPKRTTVFRALASVNHTDMGNYAEAVSSYLTGRDLRPDLSAHIHPGETSYGFGLNGEQEMNDYVRLFGRFGWNQGAKEAFQFAEADHTLALGADVDGKMWRHSGHRAGIAMAINGLESNHRQYLELGGTSYLLGDTGLAYGRERILESYYNVRLLHGIYGAFDVQRIWNPGYNRNRGPVVIFGVRLHLEGELHFN